MSKPAVVEDSGEIRVSVDVEIETPCAFEFARELWFKLPISRREYVSDRSDGFAAALLPLAMWLGEPLEIDGALSPRLFAGMHEFQRFKARLFPKNFETIDIVPSLLEEPDRSDVLGGVACAFSGGVDSFHTLQRHLPENEPVESFRITHGLMISGFGGDRDSDGGKAVKSIAEAYRPMMDRLGVELVVARTNIMELYDSRLLIKSHAAVITGTALVLGRLLKRLFIASDHRFDRFIDMGSDALYDHWLGTETLEVCHDASDDSRLEKVRAISGWSETYSTLRVCWASAHLIRKDGVLRNCCRCEKCIRTMSALEVLGALERYEVFPRPLRYRDLWKYRRRHLTAGYIWRIMGEAVRTGHLMIAFCLGVSLLRSAVVNLVVEPLRAVHVAIERRVPAYARWVEQHHPTFTSGRHWIRKLN